VDVYFEGETESHSKAVNFGFRTIELIQEPIEGVSGKNCLNILSK